MGETGVPWRAAQHFFIAGLEGEGIRGSAGFGIQVAAEEDQPFDFALAL